MTKFPNNKEKQLKTTNLVPPDLTFALSFITCQIGKETAKNSVENLKVQRNS